jgi:hypothetical protein
VIVPSSTPQSVGSVDETFVMFGAEGEVNCIGLNPFVLLLFALLVFGTSHVPSAFLIITF